MILKINYEVIVMIKINYIYVFFFKKLYYIVFLGIFYIFCGMYEWSMNVLYKFNIYICIYILLKISKKEKFV